MLLIGAIALALFVLPPVWGIVAVSLGVVIELDEVAFWVRFLRRYRVATGAEALAGASAEVIEDCGPRGRSNPISRLPRLDRPAGRHLGAFHLWGRR